MSEIHSLYHKFRSSGKHERNEILDLKQTLSKLAMEYINNVDKGDFLNVDDPKTVADKIDRNPPQHPLKSKEIVSFVGELMNNFPSTNSKQFLGYVPSDPDFLSMVVASLTPYLNQFVGSVQGSPGGTAVEALVIRWIAQLLDMPTSTFGCFTSGGSMANMTAIYTGLNQQLRHHGINLHENGLIGNKRPVIYISDQTHNAIEKSLLMLGLGRKSIRVLPSDREFKLTGSVVKSAIKSDLENNLMPIMIIATAGTTNTGSIDELKELYQISREFELWLHVDGAYGAFTSLTNLDVAQQTANIKLADSIALDCHKWFYTPFEAGIALVRDHQIMKATFDLSAEYLKDSDLVNDIILQRNFRSYGLPLTRELRGLKVWAVFAALGVEGIKNAISRDILKAKYLEELLNQTEMFEVINSVEMSIVCFTYKGEGITNQQIIEQLNKKSKFFLSSTSIRGEIIIRVCFLNQRSDLSTVDLFYNELIDITSQ